MPVITHDQRIVADESSRACGSKHAEWISEAGGLTQFGAFVEVLQPGAQSSIKHWHAAEDELVFVLDGAVTLIEGGTETVLQPGDAATFRAGDPVGHCLVNRSQSPTRCLVIGTRSAQDRITYPDHDRVATYASGSSTPVWTDSAGQPSQSPYLD